MLDDVATMDTAASMGCPSGQGQEIGNAVQFSQRLEHRPEYGQTDTGTGCIGGTQPTEHDGNR